MHVNITKLHHDQLRHMNTYSRMRLVHDAMLAGILVN